MSTEFINDQWRLPNAWNGSESNVNKQSNYSMDFDGSGSQYINFGTDVLVDSTSSFSISGWCYINNFNSITYPGIGRFKTDQSTGFFFGVSNASGYEGVYFGSSSNFVLGKTSGDISGDFVGQWKHITIVFDGVSRTTLSSYKVYVDGSEVSTTNSGSFNPVANENRLGEGNGSNTYFDGKLDAVAIFDYALTDGTGGTVNQIATLYGSSSTGIGNPMSLSPKPVATYNLGDKSAFNGANYLVPNSSLKDYVFDFIPNDYIDIGNQNELKNITELSVSLWFNYDSIGSSADGLVARDSSSRVDGNWYVALDYNNSIRFLLKTANGQDALNSSTISPNKWYHTLCVWDGQNMKIYLNGSLDNSITLSNATGTLGNASDVVAIGRRFASGGFLNGKASNVQIFNTALPATGSNSVETLYNNGSPLTSMSGFTSLQGWWKLDASDTYDGTNWTIEDHAGSNDGTSSGMTQANLVQSDLSFTSGYSPYALDFDGTNDYIDCGNDASFNLTTGLTVSAWVKLTAYQNDKFILAKRWASNSFQIATAGGGKSQCSVWIGSTRYDAIGSTVLSADTWYNIVGTFDGSNVKVYVNSTLEDTTPASGNLATTTDIVSIAKGLNNNSYNFNGSISNVSIWNVGLTSSQITELYNSGVPSNLNNHSAVSSLVSWWQLGSNSSFNSSLNQWTCIDEKGTNTGESSQTFNEDAIVDGVGSYANGLSSGMGGDEVIGSAPFSDANSLSVNMDVEDRVTDTPS